jgi:hypothetical protein
MEPYFQSVKGARQGVLNQNGVECSKNGLFVWLASDLIPNGIAILQYGDDTIEHDLDEAINLKLLLYVLELMSGLKINYMKSEVFVVTGDNYISLIYANMFNRSSNILGPSEFF